MKMMSRSKMMRERFSERPTFLYVGAGGTIGLVILFILEPYMPQPLSMDVSQFIYRLGIWWLAMFVGGFALGQLKINRPPSRNGKDQS